MRALIVCGCLAACAARPVGPELYEPGVFSTTAWDFFVAFTPDQQRALLCRADETFQRYEIFETRRDAAGHWSPPAHPAFAAQWSNADPHFTADGKRAFFISNRPDPGETAEHATYAIWVVALGDDGAWGTPERLPAPVDEPGIDRWSPSVAANGDLYFGAERPGGHGGSDLWVARWRDGRYQPLENLGDAINTEGNEVEPWIAPDGSYLIFSAVGRRDSFGSYDLYVSQQRDGRWTPARHLPAPINTAAREFNQSVSPDGKWLYFSTTRASDDPRLRGAGNGKTGDIYRVPLGDVLR